MVGPGRTSSNREVYHGITIHVTSASKQKILPVLLALPRSVTLNQCGGKRKDLHNVLRYTMKNVIFGSNDLAEGGNNNSLFLCYVQ